MLSSHKYNKLPIVGESHKVGETLVATRNRLCTIISAHNLQDFVCVRLIHKHFDMTDNEVAVFRPVKVDGICTAIIMGPMPSDTPKLAGKHYLYDHDAASFVAYEHTTVDGFDLSNYPEFLKAYKEELLQSEASHVYGIGIQERDTVLREAEYTEFDLENLRTTIMVPSEMVPLGATDVTNPTNWMPAKDGKMVPAASCRGNAHGGTCKGTKHKENDGISSTKLETAFDRMLADAESPLAKVVAHTIAVMG